MTRRPGTYIATLGRHASTHRRSRKGDLATIDVDAVVSLREKRLMKAFSDLYRRLKLGDLDPAKQRRWSKPSRPRKTIPCNGKAGVDDLFFGGSKPRQTVPTRLLWPWRSRARDCRSGSARNVIQMWRSRHMLSLLLPEGVAGEGSLDLWMRERLLPLPALDEEERYARLKRWVRALPLISASSSSSSLPGSCALACRGCRW